MSLLRRRRLPLITWIVLLSQTRLLVTSFDIAIEPNAIVLMWFSISFSKIAASKSKKSQNYDIHYHAPTLLDMYCKYIRAAAAAAHVSKNTKFRFLLTSRSLSLVTEFSQGYILEVEVSSSYRSGHFGRKATDSLLLLLQYAS